MISFKNLILESWKSYKPSNNPKTLFFDFYVLSYLSTLPLSHQEKGFRGSFVGRNSQEIKMDIDYAQSVLLVELTKN